MHFQDGNMDNYIKLLQEHRVSHLVCATDQLYKTEELVKSGNKSSYMRWLGPKLVAGSCGKGYADDDKTGAISQ